MQPIKILDISEDYWRSISPENFWSCADELQRQVLEEAKKLFSILESADPVTLRELLIQYRYFTIYYIPDLALLVARMEDGALRSFLADILHDELGCGNAESAHPKLYDSFLSSIGIDVSTLNDKALEKNIDLLDAARKRLVDPALSNEYSIGLRGMGGECVCQVYIEQLYECLIKNPYIKNIKSDIDWRFWTLHVGDHDIEHREKTRSLIHSEIVVKGGKGLSDMGIGYEYSMNSWGKFWINIFDLSGEDGLVKSLTRSSVKSTVNVSVFNEAIPTS